MAENLNFFAFYLPNSKAALKLEEICLLDLLNSKKLRLNGKVKAKILAPLMLAPRNRHPRYAIVNTLILYHFHLEFLCVGAKLQ